VLDQDARECWESVYPALTADREGLVGELVARAAPMAIRLALVYAILDGSTTIRSSHLRAALAVVDYGEQTARHVFGDSVGDALADALRSALKAASSRGLTREQIRSDVLHRNVSAQRITAALETLERLGLAVQTTEETGGRRATRWRSADASLQPSTTRAA
jgi:hypothetical protein